MMLVGEGINVLYVWGFFGGDGVNIIIIDIERGWKLDYEDLVCYIYLFFLVVCYVFINRYDVDRWMLILYF